MVATPQREAEGGGRSPEAWRRERNARPPDAEHDARALLLRMVDLRRLDAHHGDAADKARSVHRHYARGRG